MALVYASGEINPLEQLAEVEHGLAGMGKGTVVFDLLLANGSPRSRYQLGLFDGTGFLAGQFHLVEDTEELRAVTAAFLKAHLEELNLERVIECALRNGVPG